MSEPPIRQAIHFTQDTLVARAASYRNLVVTISLGIVSLLILTLVTWNLRTLLALCWLLPLVNGWLWIDARRVRRWRSRVLEICELGQLDVEIFRSTIAHLKHLPQSTLSGMLDLLPASPTTLPGIMNEESSVAQDQARRTEQTYWISLIVSAIGCTVVTSSLFVTTWLVLPGLAIWVGSAKLSQWITSCTYH